MQIRFSLPSNECSAVPPSFRQGCLTCAQRFDLITARSEDGTKDEPSLVLGTRLGGAAEPLTDV